MRGQFEKLKWELIRWMNGRYGVDQLSTHLCWLALILVMLSVFLDHPIWTVLVYVCWAVALFRSLSKNLEKRRREADTYHRMLERVISFFTLQKLRWEFRKTHKFFRCKCGRILRVPKGQGNIKIICPGCHAEIVKKT